MNLKYRAAVNCTLYFDVDAETEDQAQEFAEQIIEEISGSTLKEMDRGLINSHIEIEDSYPEIHEN